MNTLLQLLPSFHEPVLLLAVTVAGGLVSALATWIGAPGWGTGRRMLAIEDTGNVSPWDIDLTGRVHLVVGGEARGIPDAILAACDAVVRIPMPGFVPSYNLQGAVAAVASERLRQLEGNPG